MANLRLGFIGLGFMGRPMYSNLLKAGYEVTVWNRSRPGITEMVALGAVEAACAREVAERSDVVITMVKHGGDTDEVALGPNGLSSGAQPGMVLMDMTTTAKDPALLGSLSPCEGRLTGRASL